MLILIAEGIVITIREIIAIKMKEIPVTARIVIEIITTTPIKEITTAMKIQKIIFILINQEEPFGMGSIGHWMNSH
jgi:hypothetical protein